MSELVTAIGLVFVIEGLLYALAPGLLKRLAVMIEQMPEESMRTNGAWAIGAGVLIVWLARTYLT
jgi:uncharacterized protein YjeT (DUF2065 family)